MSIEKPKPDPQSDESVPRHIDEVDKTQTSASPPTETREHTPAPSAAGVPKRIGQYSIKRAIASGGMGTVYEAVQEKPRRTACLPYFGC